MFRLIATLCLGLIGTTALAGPLSDAACEQLLITAENHADARIYEDCDFGNEIKAWEYWAPFVSAHNMKRGIFELCKRYPDHPYGPLYCDKAIQLNFGPALIARGQKTLKNGKVKEALTYFNQALKTNDLGDAEIKSLTETLGIIYLTPDTPEYNPQSGLALLTKASRERSAMANNALGYLIFSGRSGVKANDPKALEYIWRAALLGCPAAEENLGAFHLARQGKITRDDAIYYMSLQAFTCEPFNKEIPVDLSLAGCPCADILEKEAFLQSQPYLFLDMQDGKALIRDKEGNSQLIKKGDFLSETMMVHEVKSNLITLIQGDKKVFINRYHIGQCVDKCLKQARQPQQRRPVGIRPYHFTFTQRECADILYYANKLVDTDLEYVGKKECLGPEMDETTKMLLQRK